MTLFFIEFQLEMLKECDLIELLVPCGKHSILKGSPMRREDWNPQRLSPTGAVCGDQTPPQCSEVIKAALRHKETSKC